MRQRGRAVMMAAIAVAAMRLQAMEIACNPGPACDWSDMQPFKDVFQVARPWCVIPATSNWDYAHAHLGYTEGTIPAAGWRSDGYPTQVPSSNGMKVVTLMLVNMNPRGYPFGTFTLMFEGRGDVYLGWDAGGPSAAGWVEGQITPGHGFTVTGAGGTTTRQFTISSASRFFGHYCTPGNSSGILLHINRSEASDPIRNIRVIAPDPSGGTSYVQDYQNQPFVVQFLEEHVPFSCLRFMDWCGAFFSEHSEWSDRPAPSVCGPRRGELVPYEYMVQLGNLLDRDIWICLPYRATNRTYMDSLAALVKRTLESGRKVYVEYGNEIWNSATAYYAQQQYLNSMAGTWGVSGWQQAQVKASIMLFEAFERQFGVNSPQVVNVIAGWHINTDLTQTLVSAINNTAVNPNRTRVDAFATAPYIYGNSISTLLSNATQPASYASGHKSICDGAGLTLISYEGGQHQVTGDVIGTNRDAQMYTVYTNYLNSLAPYYAMLNQYVSVMQVKTDGAWGAKEFQGQPMSEAHKYRALYDYIVAHGQFNPNSTRPWQNVAVQQPRYAAAAHPAQRNGLSLGLAAFVFDPMGRLTRMADADNSIAVAPGVRLSWGRTTVDVR